MKSVIEGYQDNGWIFKYEPSTKFIGVCHPNGEKQSICELVNHFESDVLGEAITEFLNKKTFVTSSKNAGNQRLKGLLAGWKNIAKSFENKDNSNTASIIGNCISDLEALLSMSVNEKK